MAAPAFCEVVYPCPNETVYRVIHTTEESHTTIIRYVCGSHYLDLREKATYDDIDNWEFQRVEYDGICN